jgi:hypothetical protein
VKKTLEGPATSAVSNTLPRAAVSKSKKTQYLLRKRKEIISGETEHQAADSQNLSFCEQQ